jgi:hypothetical protein
VVVVVPMATTAGTVLFIVVSRGRLPDPVATHWGLAGSPDGSMGLPAYTAFVTVSMGLVWAALVAGSRRSVPAAPLTAVTYFVLGVLGAVNVQVVAANLDARSWDRASPMTALGLAAVLGAGAVLGGIGWFAVGASAGVPADRPMEIAAASGRSWSGSATNGWLVIIGIAPLLLVPIIGPVWIFVLGPVALASVVFASVRVTVDASRICIESGPFGRPARCIPVGEVTSVAAVRIEPMAYGGWGYRMRSGVRAYVVRGGPAIRIGRSTGPDLLVTVDDAARGAATIAALLRSGDQDADGE